MGLLGKSSTTTKAFARRARGSRTSRFFRFYVIYLRQRYVFVYVTLRYRSGRETHRGSRLRTLAVTSTECRIEAFVDPVPYYGWRSIHQKWYNGVGVIEVTMEMPRGPLYVLLLLGAKVPSLYSPLYPPARTKVMRSIAAGGGFDCSPAFTIRG